MSTGVVVLGVALLAATVLGLVHRRGSGRFRTSGTVLTPDDLAADLGSGATLVQFSSAFCAPCRATRVLLRDIASKLPDVAYVELDAESHLDLVRRLDVRRTPTVLVLDASGRITSRASGQPRKDDVLNALELVGSTPRMP